MRCALPTTMAFAVAVAVPSSAAAEHANGHRAPTEPAPVEFAPDFVPPIDDEYGWPVGGFGGIERGAPLTRLPVIFVHGNQGDAQNWYEVRDQFTAEAGYTDQELWAISYGGLGYVGGTAPTVPDSEALYVVDHPAAAISGNPQNNEVNVPDLIDFIRAVQDYTGSGRVHVVAHSLGVTLVRKAMFDEPSLRDEVVGAVMIAGANHGTSICRGLDDDYYGCDEIAPGTPWLAALNEPGEALGPTRWMTVYDGTGAGDIFYDPLVADSPRLEGAEVNATYSNTSHNDLRVSAPIVSDYLAFLMQVEADAVAQPDAPPAPAATSEPAADPVPGAAASDATEPAPTTGQPLPATGSSPVVGWLGMLVAGVVLLAGRRPTS